MKQPIDTATPDLLDAEQPAANLPAVRPTHAPTVQAGPVTPADLLRYALDSGADLDRLEKLMELKERHEKNEARKAYVSDMAAFKLDPPEIVKDKAVGYTNKDGSFTGYHHATLGNVTGAIIEGLARHGFSHSWDTQQQGANVVVTCIITHRLGHSESTTLSAAKDDSGKKNSIQQMASAITYLQRYTLLAATGLATHDQDDDGAGAEEPGNEGDTPKRSLAEEWIAKVKAAPTDAEVVKVWDVGIPKFVNDPKGHAAFKKAVEERRGDFIPKKGA